MGKTQVVLILVLASVVAALGAQEPQQFVTIEELDGVTHFARVETTVACAGSTLTKAIPELKKMGFVSVFNLREASEPDANIDGEAAAAKAAGMKFFHIPVNGQAPDPKALDQFLDAISSPGAQPAFIHCQAGNRSAMMWFAKRLILDHWDEERAITEAGPLGLTSERLRAFVVEYARTHHR